MSFLLVISAVAALELPSSLKNLQVQNEQSSQRFLQTITFFVAFLAGIISFVSPCILPIVPAFFAYTFKQRRDLVKATLAFSTGMISMMVSIGLVAAYIGRLLLDTYRSHIVLYAGIVLIIMGVLVILGKGFGFSSQQRIQADSLWKIVGFGAVFGIGFTPCLGPIYTGILAIAMVLNNYIWSGLLFTFYGLGIAFPLFVFSVYYDKLNLGSRSWMRGKAYMFDIFGKKFQIHSHNLISGALLIFFGVLFVLYRGTYLFNTLTGGTLSMYWYMFNDALLAGNTSWYWAAVTVFLAASIFFLYSLVGMFKRRK